MKKTRLRKAATAPLVAAAGMFLMAANPAVAQLPGEVEQYDGLTLNPAMLEPGRGDAPVSVTVITRQELQVLGITNIVDALRLVPGMNIATQSVSRTSVGYHGTNPVVPRRMEVLVDGMSINLASASTVYWNAFPVSVEDIERIEITRNPNMPLNGAHSFQSTVNFVTRHPADDSSNEVVVMADTNGLGKQSVRFHGAMADTSVALRFENSEDPGFEVETSRTPDGFSTRPALDGQHDKKVTFSSSTALSDRVELRFLAGMMDAEIQRRSNDVNALGLNNEGFDSHFINGTLTYDDGDNDAWTFQASTKGLDVERSWSTCYPTFMFLDELRAMHLANPDYAAALVAGQIPSGGSPSDNALALAALTKVMSMGGEAFEPNCGSINENFEESKQVLSVENVHSFSEALRIISGAEYEHSAYESQTLIGGEADMDTYSIYTSAEYRVSSRWTTSLGGLYAYDDLNSESNRALLAGVSFSFAPTHTAKVTYADSFRSPGILEKSFYWSYFMTGFSNPFDGKESGLFYRVTQNPYASKLSTESLQSLELSFDGSFMSNAIEYNVRIFKERLRDLISQDINFNVVELNNNNSADLDGAEGEVHYRYDHRWKFSAGYSYVDNTSSHINETILYHPHSGFAKVTFITGDYSASFAYYSASNDYTSFDRVEATLGKSYRFGPREVFWQAKINTQANDYVNTLGRISGTGSDRTDAVGWFSYEDDWNVGLKAGVRF